MNIPRGFGYFLPWVLCLPVLKRAPNERTLAWGIGIAFVVVSLLPGSLARYTMPLLVPAVLAGRDDCWKGELRIPLLVSAIVCVAMLIYGFAITPYLQRRESEKHRGADQRRASVRRITLCG